MPLSDNELILLVCFSTVFFFLCVGLLSQYLLDFFKYQDRIRRRNRARNNNRIVPINRLIQLMLLRTRMEQGQRYLTEIENHNKVMAELKNKIIVINPDESIVLGTEN